MAILREDYMLKILRQFHASKDINWNDIWIDIDKQRPPMNTRILFANAKAKWVSIGTLGTADDEPDGMWYHESDYSDPLTFDEVSHWMPMPPPPKDI